MLIHLVHGFYIIDSWSEIYSDISCTSLAVNFVFCMKSANWVDKININKIGLY